MVKLFVGTCYFPDSCFPSVFAESETLFDVITRDVKATENDAILYLLIVFVQKTSQGHCHCDVTCSYIVTYANESMDGVIVV